MAESKIWISPTLQTSIRYPKILSLRAKRDSGSILEDETDELNMLEKRARLRLDIVRKMLDFGLLERIVPGTDSGVASIPFGHLDYDLQLLVEVGFTPEQALASATRVSAEAIGQIDKLGTLGPGKSADFVVLDGDPTVDISAVSRVVAVFMGGNRYK